MQAVPSASLCTFTKDSSAEQETSTRRGAALYYNKKEKELENVYHFITSAVTALWPLSKLIESITVI